MAKKPSFDTAKIKEFLFQKGERLGLAVIGGISLLLLVLAFMGITTKPPASANSPTWPEAFSKEAKKMEGQLRDSRPPENEPDKDKWFLASNKVKDPIEHPTSSAEYSPYQFEPNNKKRNPRILPVSYRVDKETRDMQVDYLPAPALVYGLDLNAKKIDLFNGQPVMDLEPRHMVVVTAAFPYQEQLKIYADALKFKDVDEVVKAKMAPHFLGINVWRTEVVPAAKEEEKEKNAKALYVYNQEQRKMYIHPPLDQFIRKMVLDSENATKLGNSLAPNMVTPLPMLASVKSEAGGDYPKVALTGFEEQVPTEDGTSKTTKTGGARMQPPVQASGGKGAKGDKGGGDIRRPMFWTQKSANIDSDLQARFEGNYNVFDTMAKPEFKETSKDTKDKKNRQEKDRVPVGVAPDDKAAELPKLLVRFFDIDVEPGKEYRYWIQVRMANPNFGNSKEVSDPQAANIPELVSEGFVPTPSVTIPFDVHYYAYDQVAQSTVKLLSSKPKGTLEGTNTSKSSESFAPVQIHRWIKSVNDSNENTHMIGDWAVAERLLVKRGDPIGHTVQAEVPEWDWRQGRFILGVTPVNAKAKSVPHLAINFQAEDGPAPFLVDFQGGFHDKYHVGKSTIIDNGAVELLILDEKGKLVLRNSLDDSEDPERLKTYARWARRLEAVRGQGGDSKAPSRSGPGVSGPGIR
jgi:hypothetical protein